MHPPLLPGFLASVSCLRKAVYATNVCMQLGCVCIRELSIYHAHLLALPCLLVMLAARLNFVYMPYVLQW
jgi:hypothetical protein